MKEDTPQTKQKLTGILVADSWSDEGHPLTLKLCSVSETDYLLALPPEGLGEFSKFCGKTVQICGQIRDQCQDRVLEVMSLKELL